MLTRIIFTLLFLLVAIPVSAQEMITNFDTQIKINIDSSILVTETIDYDFGVDAVNKHGIFRDILYKYKARGGNFNLRIDDISVLDAKGHDYNFIVDNKGEYRSIKIGDPNLSVSGKNRYVIKYQVRRAVNYFNDYDELYWNATGDEWEVPIKQSKTTVLLPSEAIDLEVKTECFSGPSGSTRKCSYIKRTYGGKDLVSSIVFINEKLNSGEGLTVVIGLPKGLIQKESFLKSVSYIIMDNWILGIPLIVFLIMFILWRRLGADPAGKETIVVQFDTIDNLTPAEIGTIINEKIDNHEISSQIIDLAVRGYLKITKVEKGKIFKSDDYLIKKLKEENDLDNEFEKMLMRSLFHSADTSNIVKLSSLKNYFYKDLEKIKKELYSSLTKRGYFLKNPQKVRNKYIVIGFLIGFFGIFISVMFQSFYIVVAMILSAIIVIAFSFIMPVKTRKGVLAREHILGFKNYLSVAEKDRINFHNAPEKNPKRFEKLLPFAMALGVEKAWAKQFKDIYIDKNPSWYSDSSSNGFSPASLVGGLNSFNSRASSALTSSPSSSSSGGSGFSSGGSGGGFGGGGGGSW